MAHRFRVPVLDPGHGLCLSPIVPGTPFNRNIQNLIANLRGLPEDRGRSRIRDTRTIDELMQRLVQRHSIGIASPEDTIRDAWPSIVGASNDQFAQPSRIERERCLVIAVSDPVVRQELQFNKPLIIKRIRALAGCGKIREVVFRAG